MNQSHSLSTDLDRLRHAHQARRCVHTKTNGTVCKSPAMKDNIYCFFHLQIHDTSRSEFEPIDIGTLEDANSIQMSIQRVLSAALRGQIDQKTARLALYGLQIATRNLKNCNFEPQLAEEVVLDHCNNTLDDLRCANPECECNGEEDSTDEPRDRHKWVRRGDNTDTQDEKNLRDYAIAMRHFNPCKRPHLDEHTSHPPADLTLTQPATATTTATYPAITLPVPYTPSPEPTSTVIYGDLTDPPISTATLSRERSEATSHPPN